MLNVVSGLQYARVGGDLSSTCGASCDEHLQRLSPRYYAKTRLGDIVSRINNDISEIQRVAAEAALAWRQRAVLLGSVGPC